MWSLLSGYIFGWPHDLEGWLVTSVFHYQECICEAGKWRACWFHGHGNSSTLTNDKTTRGLGFGLVNKIQTDRDGLAMVRTNKQSTETPTTGKRQLRLGYSRWTIPLPGTLVMYNTTYLPHLYSVSWHCHEVDGVKRPRRHARYTDGYPEEMLEDLERTILVFCQSFSLDFFC